MKSKTDFIGKWRIIEMSAWDKDYFDEEVPAYIKIEKNFVGDFHLRDMILVGEMMNLEVAG